MVLKSMEFDDASNRNAPGFIVSIPKLDLQHNSSMQLRGFDRLLTIYNQSSLRIIEQTGGFAGYTLELAVSGDQF